jgi:DNA-binding GntR family transcriptional regulator
MTDIAAPTLVQHAAQRLRRDILDGRIRPMQKLKVEELREVYGISNTPLREALHRLAQEGLVSSDLRRGFRAAPMSLADLQDITRLRLLVECDALVASIQHGTSAWEEGVRRAYEMLEKTAATMDDGPATTTEDWADVHKAFHMATLAACPSARELEICASLFDQAERYRRLSARRRAIPRQRSQEHAQILRAVLARDIGTALLLHRQHLDFTLASIGKNIDWGALQG